MLKIHSFLQGIKNCIKNGSEECFKFCLLIAGYTIVAIILVLSSQGLSGENSNYIMEAYAKTNQITEGFAKNQEETAEKANIRTDQNEEKLQIRRLNIYDMRTMGGMVEEKTKAKNPEKKAIVKQTETKVGKKLKTKVKVKKKSPEVKKKAVKEAVIKLSSGEKEILQRIVEAEATGEDIKGRILVANVILNRVKNKQFPDTVKEVVFQRSGGSVQFSPTKDGRYWSVTISKKTKEAVDRVLKGEDYSQGALYFSARSRADKNSMRWFDNNLKWLFKYHGHEFYTNK